VTTSRLVRYDPAPAIASRSPAILLGAFPRLFLKAAAAVFLLGMTAYSVGLIYYMRHAEPAAVFGATYEFVDATVQNHSG
jgi:hypothetical protein